VSDLLEEFVFDSREHLGKAQSQLLELENDPGSRERLNALMGTLHTVKGNSGFVNLRHLYELLHSAESLLQTVRETGRDCPRPVVDRLFQVLDTAEAIMGRLENDEDDEVDWMPSLLEALGEMSRSLEAGGDGSPPVPSVAPASGGSASGECEAGPGWAGPPDAPDPAPRGSFPFDADLPVQLLNLTDGKMAEEGRCYVEGSRELLRKGALGLILDMRSITSITGPEVRILRELRDFWGPRLAIVASRESQPDLCRIFDVLEPQGFKGLYPAEEAARDALK
jgi:HPt (histidine-containing phosphotransfer) domain-containing protein